MTHNPHRINLRLWCKPCTDRPTYGLAPEEVAERIELEADNLHGAFLLDASEFTACLKGGVQTFTATLEVEADTEEAALDALDDASAFVPGWEIVTWQTVPHAIDGDDERTA